MANRIQPLTLGDHVHVSSSSRIPSAKDKMGFLRYIGKIHCSAGCWAGLELDLPHGQNDGSLDGCRYFQCNPHRGLFVRTARCRRRYGRFDASDEHHASFPAQYKRNLASKGRNTKSQDTTQGLPETSVRAVSSFLTETYHSSTNLVSEVAADCVDTLSTAPAQITAVSNCAWEPRKTSVFSDSSGCQSLPEPSQRISLACCYNNEKSLSTPFRVHAGIGNLSWGSNNVGDTEREQLPCRRVFGDQDQAQAKYAPPQINLDEALDQIFDQFNDEFGQNGRDKAVNAEALEIVPDAGLDKRGATLETAAARKTQRTTATEKKYGNMKMDTVSPALRSKFIKEVAERGDYHVQVNPRYSDRINFIISAKRPSAHQLSRRIPHRARIMVKYEEQKTQLSLKIPGPAEPLKYSRKSFLGRYLDEEGGLTQVSGVVHALTEVVASTCLEAVSERPLATIVPFSTRRVVTNCNFLSATDVLPPSRFSTRSVSAGLEATTKFLNKLCVNIKPTMWKYSYEEMERQQEQCLRYSSDTRLCEGGLGRRARLPGITMTPIHEKSLGASYLLSPKEKGEEAERNVRARKTTDRGNTFPAVFARRGGGTCERTDSAICRDIVIWKQPAIINDGIVEETSCHSLPTKSQKNIGAPPRQASFRFREQSILLDPDSRDGQVRVKAFVHSSLRCKQPGEVSDADITLFDRRYYHDGLLIRRPVYFGRKEKQTFLLISDLEEAEVWLRDKYVQEPGTSHPVSYRRVVSREKEAEQRSLIKSVFLLGDRHFREIRTNLERQDREHSSHSLKISTSGADPVIQHPKITSVKPDARIRGQIETSARTLDGVATAFPQAMPLANISPQTLWKIPKSQPITQSSTKNPTCRQAPLSFCLSPSNQLSCLLELESEGEPMVHNRSDTTLILYTMPASPFKGTSSSTPVLIADLAILSTLSFSPSQPLPLSLCLPFRGSKKLISTSSSGFASIETRSTESTFFNTNSGGDVFLYPPPRLASRRRRERRNRRQRLVAGWQANEERLYPGSACNAPERMYVQTKVTVPEGQLPASTLRQITQTCRASSQSQRLERENVRGKQTEYVLSQGNDYSRNTGQFEKKCPGRKNRGHVRRIYLPPPGPPPSPSPNQRQPRSPLGECSQRSQCPQQLPADGTGENMTKGAANHCVFRQNENISDAQVASPIGKVTGDNKTYFPRPSQAKHRAGVSDQGSALLELAAIAIPWLPPPTPPPPEARRRGKRSSPALPPTIRVGTQTPSYPSIRRGGGGGCLLYQEREKEIPTQISQGRSSIAWGINHPEGVGSAQGSDCMIRQELTTAAIANEGGYSDLRKEVSSVSSFDDNETTDIEAGNEIRGFNHAEGIGCEPGDKRRVRQNDATVKVFDTDGYSHTQGIGSSCLARNNLGENGGKATTGSWGDSYEGSVAKRRAERNLVRIKALEASFDRVEKQAIGTLRTYMASSVDFEDLGIDHNEESTQEAARNTLISTTSIAKSMAKVDERGGAVGTNLVNTIETKDNTKGRIISDVFREMRTLGERASPDPPPAQGDRQRTQELNRNIILATDETDPVQGAIRHDGTAFPMFREAKRLDSGREGVEQSAKVEDNCSQERQASSDFYFNLGKKMVLDGFE